MLALHSPPSGGDLALGVSSRKMVMALVLALALFAALLTAPAVSDAGTDARPSAVAQVVPDAVEEWIGIDAVGAGFWGCLGAVTALVAGKILKLGGAWRAAKKIVTAAKVIKRYGWAWNSGAALNYLGSTVLAGLGEISGITAVLKKCA